MLKLLNTTNTPEYFQNIKCAEVYCQSPESFSIVCGFCGLKIFEYSDFVLHFQNVHLLTNNGCNSSEGDDVQIKSEDAAKQDPYVDHDQASDQEYYYAKLNADGERIAKSVPSEGFANDENSWNSDNMNNSLEIDSAAFGSDNEDDEEYVPKFFQNTIKKESTRIVPLKCRDCSKSYKHAKSLEQHVKRCHSGALEYKCARCERVYQNEQMLHRHEQREHGGFPCPDCDKVYKSKESLQVHAFNHTGVRNFACDVDNCVKAFFNRKQLHAHKRHVHTSERNFVCEVCGYRTKIKNALIVHRRSHTGERPYVCKTCSKGFASQALLHEHQPIHSQERPHKCDVCGATFSRPKALYHHKHLHLAIKKFVCKICGKAYAQASGLSGHMRQHKMQQ